MTHTYTSSGSKEISITENEVGGFAGVASDGGPWAAKLLEITNWGTNKWLNFFRAFDNCVNLVITATDASNVVMGTNVDFTEAFKHCISLTSFPLMDTSSVSDVTSAWQNCTGLTSFPLLDLSHAYRFSDTWSGCTSLANFPLINVGLGQYFDSTWKNCTSLNVFPTIIFNTMSDGYNCFDGCTLDTVSYSDLLISLSVVNPQTTCTFSGGNSKYNSSAVAARTFLTDGQLRLWTITDGGLE
jgi:hypothetical protein